MIVRQQARREPALRAVLEPLQDGYGVVTSSVADLLDAGLEAAHSHAFQDCLAGLPEDESTARALALGRVAVGTLRALDEVGLEHGSGLFRRACQAFERDPEGTLPSRAVLIHGYADVTGVQLELLLAFLRRAGGLVFLDEPPAPPAGPGPDPGVAFTERLRERLRSLCPLRPIPASPPPLAAPVCFRAPGAQAEARAVAESVRRLIDAGVVPERIGIVVRDLAPHAIALRVQLRRLGVPFSGAPGATGPLDARGRRVRALLDLIRTRERLSVDRWLEAVGPRWAGAGSVPRVAIADLRVGLHALGVGRLADLSRLDVDGVLDPGGGLRLPAREELRTVPAEGTHAEGQRVRSPGAVRAVRRRLAGARLREAAERGRRLVQHLEGWSRVRRAGAHPPRLRDLLDGDLGWDPGDPLTQELLERVEVLERELPGDFPLDLDEFARVAERRLAEVGSTPFGGGGAGVRVLDVVAARAHTFEHLFVLGLNRDLFPRPPGEDPLLPDRMRSALTAILPDIPVKRRAVEEERYLFAQLYSAAAHLTLSWQTVTDDGKERIRSTLLEPLRDRVDPDAVALVPSLLAAARASDSTVAKPAWENALLAGLHGGRRGRCFGDALEIALGETRLALGLPDSPVDPGELSRVRRAVLDELDPSLARARELGPYFGFVGSLGDGPDPRSGAVFVTTLERLARCPWRAFLERLLHLEPLPDPLAALPDTAPLLLGQLVHRVLEEIVGEALGERPRTLGAVTRRDAVDVPWPAPERLEAMLLGEARRVLRGAGILVPGFEVLLVERARSLVERIRELEAAEGWLRGVAGAEVEGHADVLDRRGIARRVRFLADRVDVVKDGLRLTDYKSGALQVDARQEKTRRRKLVGEIASGRLLQAAAYAFADVEGVCEGRYLFAKPNIDAPSARVGVLRSDTAARDRFRSTVCTLLHAWDAGSFFPRLADADGGRGSHECEGCPFSVACLRGDSGARRRLLRWIEERADSGGEPESALRELWRLGGTGGSRPDAGLPSTPESDGDLEGDASRPARRRPGAPEPGGAP